MAKRSGRAVNEGLEGLSERPASGHGHPRAAGPLDAKLRRQRTACFAHAVPATDRRSASLVQHGGPARVFRVDEDLHLLADEQRGQAGRVAGIDDLEDAGVDPLGGRAGQ